MNFWCKSTDCEMSADAEYDDPLAPPTGWSILFCTTCAGLAGYACPAHAGKCAPIECLDCYGAKIFGPALDDPTAILRAQIRQAWGHLVEAFHSMYDALSRLKVANRIWALLALSDRVAVADLIACRSILIEGGIELRRRTMFFEDRLERLQQLLRRLMSKN